MDDAAIITTDKYTENNSELEIPKEKRSEAEEDLFTELQTLSSTSSAAQVESTSQSSLYSGIALGSLFDHTMHVIPIPVKAHELNVGKDEYRPFAPSQRPITLPIPLQIFPLKQHSSTVSVVNAILSRPGEEQENSIKRFGLLKDFINESKVKKTGSTINVDEIVTDSPSLTTSRMTEDEISSEEFPSSFRPDKESEDPLTTTLSSMDIEIEKETTTQSRILQESKKEPLETSTEEAGSSDLPSIIEEVKNTDSESKVDLKKEGLFQEENKSDSQETMTRSSTTNEVSNETETTVTDNLVEEERNSLESTTSSPDPYTTTKLITMNGVQETEQGLTKQSDLSYSVTQSSQVLQEEKISDSNVTTIAAITLSPKYDDDDGTTDKPLTTTILSTMMTSMSAPIGSSPNVLRTTPQPPVSILESTTRHPEPSSSFSPTPVFIPEKHLISSLKVPVLMYESEFANYLNRFYYSDPKVFNEISPIAQA
jgi:hypothetical protein